MSVLRLLVIAFVLALPKNVAAVDLVEPERVGVTVTQAVRRFGDLSEQGIFLGYPLEWQDRSYREGTLSSWLDVTVAHLTEKNRRGSLVSAGPSFEYRREGMGLEWVLDGGTALTWIDHDRFSRGEIGGRFHFTTHLSGGLAVGDAGSLRIRIQHTSNAGIETPNPGIDMLGLEYVVHLD